MSNLSDYQNAPMPSPSALSAVTAANNHNLASLSGETHLLPATVTTMLSDSQNGANAISGNDLNVNLTLATNNMSSPALIQHHNHQLLLNTNGANNSSNSNSTANNNTTSSTNTAGGNGGGLSPNNNMSSLNGTNSNSINNSGNNNTSRENASSSHSGYLQKWTNYIKGYQKRWFVLSNGLLSYYRSQAEMAHTCRGTINLANAQIHSEDACHFVVTNCGTQTFHLKASNELDKQKWVSALELAKNKAKQYGPNYGTGSIGLNQPDSDDEDDGLEAEKSQLANMLRTLQQKLDDLSTSQEFVLKHSNALTRSLTELESIQSRPDESLIKTINERSTVYKITMLAVVNSCQEFINLAQSQMNKMHKVLQSERDMRSKLEEMVQEMAKQHLNFETQLNKRSKRNTIVRPNNNQIGAAAVASGQSNALSNNNSKSLNNNQQQTNKQAESMLSQNAASGQRNVQSSNNRVHFNQSAGDANQQSRSSTKTSQFDRMNQNEIENEGEFFDGDDDNGDDDQFVNDDEFHDAVEDVTQFSVTLPRQKSLMHQRNPSNISKLYLQESDISSEDEDQQLIKVTMHSNKEQTNVSADASQQSNVAQSQQKQSNSNNSSSNLLTNANKKQTASDLSSLKNAIKPYRERRKEIMPRPNYSLNLWSIMKNCIGKDLSKIPIPVNFSEPLSMLQRVTEELEYSHLLDQAAKCEDQWEQMAYVAAFTVTSYSTTATRTNKPFNPLLGETYECDRLDDYGWRSVSEQVSHHPPGFSMHCESLKDWVYYQEFIMSSKFRGQYLQIIPLGTSHLEFKKSGNHYTWRKVSTFVRNIIVGKLWIDNVGEMDIINHRTKDVCHLKYFAYSYFSRDPPRKVTGIITDSNNVARYVLNGTWTEQIEGAPVLNPQVVTEQTQLNTGASKVLWTRRYPP